MEELPAIALVYEITKKVLLLNAKTEKNYRHSLSEQACSTCFEILTQLVYAKKAAKPIKENYLTTASVKAEILTFQLRAILELNLANETNVLKIQAKLTEARRQIEGWRKSM